MFSGILDGVIKNDRLRPKPSFAKPSLNDGFVPEPAVSQIDYQNDHYRTWIVSVTDVTSCYPRHDRPGHVAAND